MDAVRASSGRACLSEPGARAHDVRQEPSNESSGTARLSVVIVNYLAYDPLADCLESLDTVRSHPPTSSSSITRRSRRSLERLAARFPAMRFIPIAGNPGFAAGVNRGVRETTGEYVLLLNPDCIVASDPRPLASWMSAHPKAAVCGAIVREADGSIQASARRFPGITTGLAGRTSWLTRVWPRNPLTKRNLVRSLPDGTGRGRLGERRVHDGPP